MAFALIVPFCAEQPMDIFASADFLFHWTKGQTRG